MATLNQRNLSVRALVRGSTLWRLLTVLAIVLSSLTLARVSLQPEPSDALSTAERDQIQVLLRDLMASDPNIVVDALRLAQAQVAERRHAQAQSIVRAHATAIYADADAPALGPTDAAVTIVEFLDYQCGFCRRAHPDLAALLADDPDLRIVTKQIPILGPASLFAARAAIAADRLGHFPTFHDALMESRTRLSEEVVLKLAEHSGLDPQALVAEMEASEEPIRDALRRNAQLARNLGVTGTPAFVVGDTVLRGLPDMVVLRELIDAAKTTVHSSAAPAGHGPS